MKKVPKDIYGNEITDYHGNPIKTNPNGTITLYHRTSEQNAKEIKKTGIWKSKEQNMIFFSDDLNSEYAKPFGDDVVSIKIHPRYVELHDQFPSGENCYSIHSKHLKKTSYYK